MGYLNEEDCAQLAPKVTFEIFKAGMEIIKTGETGFRYYIVLAGECVESLRCIYIHFYIKVYSYVQLFI
jgi:CRP-like cAMP-binding protein